MSADALAGLLADLEAAFSDVARDALGMAGATVTGRSAAPPPALQGAYLPLIGPAGAVQIGLAADEPGCRAFARAFMGMGPAEPMSAEETADAICEIVNIVAGGFKARVRDRVPSLQMGLPAFFRGPVQPTEHTAVQAADLELAGLRAAVLLVHPRGGGEG